MRLTVNGEVHEVVSAPLTSLLNTLRDELDVTGPKLGCQGGSCGTCTVLVDGEPRRSCLLPLAAVDGAEITTIEGLGSPRNLHVMQAAFHYYYGSQCGFCTPGMILASVALLERNPSPSRRQIQNALGGHYCRCTGYVKIVDAVEAVARGESFEGAELTRSRRAESTPKGAPA
jgi:aerobic-type carbon monoxide dehydrogenase small subunit (CoxS/CutS family)